MKYRIYMVSQQGTSLAAHWRSEFGSYSYHFLYIDLYAGLTVSMLLIPQALAYALLAGVPLTAGILSAVFGTIICSTIGSSRHLVSGPTNATAILIFAGIAEILAGYSSATSPEFRGALIGQLLVELTLLVGVIQLVFGVLRLGRLSARIKPAVTLGYILGAAVALVINQIFVFLGIPRPMGADSVLQKGELLFSLLPETHLLTTFVGVASTLFYFLLVRKLPRLPNAIIMLGVVVGCAWTMGWEPQVGAMTAGPVDSRVALVGDMGGVEDLWQLPHLVEPLFTHLYELLPLALAIAVLSTVEGLSVSRTIANSSGQEPSLNRDLLGLATANIACAMVGGMPNSGSPSRSALNFALGAQTRLAAIAAGVSVLLVVLLLGNFIQYIPLTSLSALLLVTVLFRLISPSEIGKVWRTGKEAQVVLLAIVGSSLFFDLDNAFFIGLALSIALSMVRRLRAGAK